jgi:hypothetical protein
MVPALAYLQTKLQQRKDIGKPGPVSWREAMGSLQKWFFYPQLSFYTVGRKS